MFIEISAGLTEDMNNSRVGNINYNSRIYIGE